MYLSQRRKMALASIACMACLLAAPAAYALHDIVIVNQSAPPNLMEHLVSSEPAANTTLEQPPDNVTLYFSLPVRKDLSRVKVVDAYGNPMTDGTITVDNTSISASLSGLSSGKYKVEWRTQGTTEAQMINGNFHFTVQ